MSEIKQYALITANYWAFTITDGALRMLVVLYFHRLGYNPLEVAFLFLFYEFFGVVTNFFGGWLGARFGLNRTMNLGLTLQLIALVMLLVPADWLSIVWVMIAQALSGIAKDLNKMSAKSGIKLLVSRDARRTLYRWVAALTGSKNALKGVGFFVGGLLLQVVGFQATLGILIALLATAWIMSLVFLQRDFGKTSFKPKFRDLLSKSAAVNRLSAARFFLFAARDVWFVVALPVFLQSQLDWTYAEVGAFFAIWIIGYGFIQTLTPSIPLQSLKRPNASSALFWVISMSLIPIFIIGIQALSINYLSYGILLFGVVFALNSAIHSYLIVEYARSDGVSLDIGFYYMSNAGGRLLGTVLSGALYYWFGLTACLIASSVMLVMASIVSMGLPAAEAISDPQR